MVGVFLSRDHRLTSRIITPIGGALTQAMDPNKTTYTTWCLQVKASKLRLQKKHVDTKNSRIQKEAPFPMPIILGIHSLVFVVQTKKYQQMNELMKE